MYAFLSKLDKIHEAILSSNSKSVYRGVSLSSLENTPFEDNKRIKDEIPRLEEAGYILQPEPKYDGKEHYVIYISFPGKRNKIVIKLDRFYPFKAPRWYFQTDDNDILQLKHYIHDVLGVSAMQEFDKITGHNSWNPQYNLHTILDNIYTIVEPLL